MLLLSVSCNCGNSSTNKCNNSSSGSNCIRCTCTTIHMLWLLWCLSVVDKLFVFLKTYSLEPLFAWCATVVVCVNEQGTSTKRCKGMELSTSAPLSKHMVPVLRLVKWRSLVHLRLYLSTWSRINLSQYYGALWSMQGCKRGAVNAYLCIANEPTLLCLMASVMLRDTTDRLKVMYTEMTARLIVHLMFLLRS